MKTSSLLRSAGTLLALACAAHAADAAERVGVYDSRVLAYACFNSASHLTALRAQMAEGRAARARGDEARYRAIEAEVKAEQQRVHLQVFSTEPAPEALAALGTRVEAVQREAGVTRLVSKWDEAALRGVSAADRVDVTEALVRDLPLTEKQRQVAREIAAKPPLPLEKARQLAAQGQL